MKWTRREKKIINKNDPTRFGSSETEDILKSEPKVHSKRNKQNAARVCYFSRFFLLFVSVTAQMHIERRRKREYRKHQRHFTLASNDIGALCVGE